MRAHSLRILILVLFSLAGQAQILKHGFDKTEYHETLCINTRAHVSTDKWDTIATTPSPGEYRFIKRSAEIAFDNIWDLWVHHQKPLGLIAVRGTVATSVSFLANLYAAMIPAKGEVQLDKGFTFRYRLSDHPEAAVQVGWFVSMAYLSQTIVPSIDSCYKAGIKDFIITGHSQGGAITYLLTAHLLSLQKDGRIPADIRFKTYCSASPKPGNLFFAYDYENRTQGGWAFNVVNSADWVPDVPFSVQTINDFTEVNPFKNASAIIKKQKFPNNLVLKRAYRQLSKPGLKAQRNYEKYLGDLVSKAVKKQLPDYVSPGYAHTNYYVRTGQTVVLHPDENYYQFFKEDDVRYGIWGHHQPERYVYLLEKLEMP